MFVVAHCTKQSQKYLRIAASQFFRNVGKNFSMDNDNRGNHIVWVDMEMTGLDIDTNHILEIACIVTNQNLKIVGEELNIVIHQPDAILNSMNSWCKVHHAKTGLIEASRSSQISLKEAEQIVLEHLRRHVPEQTCPIAGNSVYMDRMFLQKYMPIVNNYLHYRIIDISTLKELFRRWHSKVPEMKKLNAHRALPDVKESIKELEYYKQHLFGAEN